MSYLLSICRRFETLPQTIQDVESRANNWHSFGMRTAFILGGGFTGTVTTFSVTSLFSTHRDVLSYIFCMYETYDLKEVPILAHTLMLNETTVWIVAAGAGAFIGAMAADRAYQNMIEAAREDD